MCFGFVVQGSHKTQGFVVHTFSHRSKPVLLFSSMGDTLKNYIMFYTIYAKTKGRQAPKSVA